MKITVGTVEQHRDIAADADFLNVPWQITEQQEATEEQPAGEIMLLEGAQAFPLTTTKEEVQDFLSRKLATFKENTALHEGAKELQAAMENGDKVAAEISGLEVTE